MNKANDISEELKSMGSFLADMPRTMPYSVPQGYFDQFPGTVHHTIKNISEPESVPAWGKSMPHNVPGGYFNNLTADLVAAATSGNVAHGLPKEIPFSTPHGYFDALPAKMLLAAKASDAKRRTIPLANRHVFRQLRWAAAALLIIGIGMGSYNMFFRSNPDKTEVMLAAVPANDIHEYLQHVYNKMDIDRVVSSTDINNLQLENKDIVQYLNETGWD